MNITNIEQKPEEFKPIERFERLIRMRERDPQALANNSIGVRTVLETYEKQKSAAEKGESK